MIKAIETVYNGYRFRSRLEARWAVFFDALGVKYEYELQGFDLGGTWYLPDFFIPLWNCYAEVKPFEFTELEFAKCVALLPTPCILLDGAPDWKRLYFATTSISDDDGEPVTYKNYLTNRNWYGVSLDWSKCAQRLWRGYIANDCKHDTWEHFNSINKTPYIIARQARFEHGETPQL
jgi:hypothetical protein